MRSAHIREIPDVQFNGCKRILFRHKPLINCINPWLPGTAVADKVTDGVNEVLI